MKGSIIEYFTKNKDVEFEYVYFNQTTEQLEEEWFNKGRNNRAKKIPVKITQKQAQLTFEEAEINIKGKHLLGIADNKRDLSNLKAKISDIRSRFAEYVESEKSILPDQIYRRIDILNAKLHRLKAQAEEQEKFYSPSKSKDNE